MKPLAIDLFCGVGGWTEGLLAEGYRVVGFDIERHRYPARILPDNDGAKKPLGIMRPDDPKFASASSADRSFNHANTIAWRNAPLTGGWHEYPAQLVIQDVLTLHGSQFKDAALIVASPPCQAYSYMAMPWSRAKQMAREYRDGTRDVKQLTALFDACFRIQREASEAAGHHIPLVVENVRGAQPWVGRSRWNYGSFHLWGDVPALMPMTMRGVKVTTMGAGWYPPDHPKHVPGLAFNGHAARAQKAVGRIPVHELAGTKTVGHVDQRNGHGHTRHLTNQAESDHVKQGGDWFNAAALDGNGAQAISRRSGSKSPARKAASALIAKIPLTLARFIASVYLP